LVARVVGFFWYFLLILGQMGIFEVGIFIDRWRGYSRRPSPDLNDELDEDPAWISPDVQAVSPDLVVSPDTPAVSPDLAGLPDTPAVSPYTVYNISKKKN